MKKLLLWCLSFLNLGEFSECVDAREWMDV